MYVLLYQDYQIQVSFLTQYNDSSLNSDKKCFVEAEKTISCCIHFVPRQLLARAMNIHNASHWF